MTVIGELPSTLSEPLRWPASHSPLCTARHLMTSPLWTKVMLSGPNGRGRQRWVLSFSRRRATWRLSSRCTEAWAPPAGPAPCPRPPGSPPLCPRCSPHWICIIARPPPPTPSRGRSPTSSVALAQCPARRCPPVPPPCSLCPICPRPPWPPSRVCPQPRVFCRRCPVRCWGPPRRPPPTPLTPWPSQGRAPCRPRCSRRAVWSKLRPSPRISQE